MIDFGEKHRKRYKKRRGFVVPARLRFMQSVFIVIGVILIARLGFLQIVQHDVYDALASGQRELYKELFPERGDILVRDPNGTEIAVATNRYLSLVWAEPRRVDDPVRTSQVLGEILGFVEDDERVAEMRKSVDENVDGDVVEDVEDVESKMDILLYKLSKEDDPYEPIMRKVSDEVADEVRQANLTGVHLQKERFRFYPEHESVSHITGFVSNDDDGNVSGKYGIEGYLNEELSGNRGFLFSELDAKGRWISVGSRDVEPAQDGADVLLTIDRTVQFTACKVLVEAVEKFQADSGSVVIVNPMTGEVRAMCGAPNFDPNVFNEVESVSVYNNQTVFSPYEPGSVFKPLIMAAGIDSGAVDQNTTYFDTGEEKIEEYTIRNSDLKSHERQTMTEVLEKSLNTGMIFVMRQMGMEQMAAYVHGFGFGEKVGVKLNTEILGTIENVDKGYEIFSATSSYGQGITVTPIQLARAYVPLANGGTMIDPFIVREIRYDNGEVEKFSGKVAGKIISSRTSQLISAMMVSVIEHGHAGKAGVDGYYLAGKTGTAQVVNDNGQGYKKDETIASFVGYGPVSNPSFVMVVRIDHPRTSEWAAGTAAPVFGEIAEFLLQYDNIPPER